MRKFLTGGVLMAAMTFTGCAYDGGYNSSSHCWSNGYYDSADGYYEDDYMRGNGYYGDHGYGRSYRNPFRVSQCGRLDPWLAETREGQQFVRDLLRLGYRNEIGWSDANRANAYFRRWADTDRNYRLTDTEIRTALIHVANGYGSYRY